MLRIPGQKPNEIKNIGTWNVATLLEGDKLENVQLEMTLLKIDILGMSKSHWPSAGINKNHQRTSNNVQSCIPISDGIIVLKLRTLPRVLNIIQAINIIQGNQCNTGLFTDSRKTRE